MAATRSSAAGCRWPWASRSPTRCSARSGVTACFFGDGAVAEGEFHESLNLAALWQLPVLFVCENNLYAMGMAMERAEAETDIARKAAAYGIAERSRSTAWTSWRWKRAARRAVAVDPRARRPAFPGVPHLSLPRAFDVRRATLPAEGGGGGVAQARADHPLSATGCEDKHFIAGEEIAAIEQEADAEIEAAVAFAEAGTLGAGERSRALRHDGRGSAMSDAAAAALRDDLPRSAASRHCARRCIADPRVFLMGEDIGRYGGCYAVTKGLLEEFGEERIRDTPLSESGVSSAPGSARRWRACGRSSRS